MLSPLVERMLARIIRSLLTTSKWRAWAGLARQRINKNSLRAPIALAVRVQVVEFHQEVCRFPCELGSRQPFEEIGATDAPKNPLRFMSQQVGRRKVGYRTPGKLRLAEQRRPELTRPGRPGKCICELPSGGRRQSCQQLAEAQLIHSGVAIQRLERDESFRAADAGNVSKNVRSRIKIRV